MATCKICFEVKPVDEFYAEKRLKAGHRSECKQCSIARARKWNVENWDRWTENWRKVKKPYQLHKKATCEDCNFVPKHPVQLDVHHVDLNHDNNDPSNLRTLCANCHRLIHYGNTCTD